MELNEILQVALRGGASDIHLKAGLPPMFRVDGSLVPLKDGRRLPPEEVARMAFGIMNEFQKEKFKQTNEVDLAYGVPGLGRFRVNVFQQRGTIGAVLRVIPFKVLTIEELMLPKVLEKIAGEERGLVLVTGTTGSGKSTTLAAMIDHINATETSHIMTIEDPIEFLIRDKRSIVNQREVGVDTMSFGQALKSALRQDPDVILVGEMRDLETIETALTAAETGHLVMSTLHTLDATETINRIISAFPPVPAEAGAAPARLGAQGGRQPAARAARGRQGPRGRRGGAPRHRARARAHRGQGPDEGDPGRDRAGPRVVRDADLRPVADGAPRSNLITYEEALRQATNPDDFALRFSGISGTSDSKWDSFEKPRGRPRRRPRPARPRRRRARRAPPPLPRRRGPHDAGEGHGAPPPPPPRAAAPRRTTTSRSSGSDGRRSGASPGPKALALRLLAGRARTAAQVRARLATGGLEGHADAVVAWLAGLGYLDDAAYARVRARTLVAPGRLGPRLAAKRLEAAGIPGAAARAAIAGAMAEAGEDEVASAAPSPRSAPRGRRPPPSTTRARARPRPLPPRARVRGPGRRAGARPGGAATERA